MVKDAGASDRGRGGAGAGARGGRGGRGGQWNNNRGAAPQGPPSYVVAFCTFEHPCENMIVVKATDTTRVPKFNRGVYLESKAKIGNVDEIFGPYESYYFSAKLDEGIKASSFKKGQTLYMSPEDLLPMERFTTKTRPGPRTGGGQRGGFRGAPRGGPRGAPRGGPRGGPRGAPRGNFRGGPRGNFRGNRS